MRKARETLDFCRRVYGVGNGNRKRKGCRHKVMDERDFSEWSRELGEQIGDRIDKFVKSRDVRELQENIRETVANTVDGVRRSVQEAADCAANYAGKFDGKFFGEEAGPTDRKTEGGRDAGAWAMPEEESRAAQKAGEKDKEKGREVRKAGKRQLPVVRKPQGKVSGTLMEVLGACGAVAGWTSAAAGYFLTFMSVEAIGLGIGVLSSGFATLFAGVCTATAVVGGIWRRRAGRFKKYVKVLGKRDFYSIEGLAEEVRKKEKYVTRDLHKMIKLGWFKEGHLDEQETCFMLTHESYGTYLEAQEQLKRRKEEEERLAMEQERMEQDPLWKQLKTAEAEGKECLRRIREMKDVIGGGSVSGKLCRLERICERIFAYVEKKPEKLTEIRKFMSYYLPTTLKLVERYHEFSIQPVQGDTIAAAKKEIEDMLDDINSAFEKMFDKLFEEDALDVSTDISVLSAMLAQEGLLEEEWKK